MFVLIEWTACAYMNFYHLFWVIYYDLRTRVVWVNRGFGIWCHGLLVVAVMSSRSSNAEVDMKRIIRACCPKAGQIYRDMLNRSFIVLKLSDRIFVEYASGELKRLKKNEWEKLQPHPSLFWCHNLLVLIRTSFHPLSRTGWGDFLYPSSIYLSSRGASRSFSASTWFLAKIILIRTLLPLPSSARWLRATSRASL